MKKGFTLIEIIIVVAVIGMTLPVVLSLFFVSIRSQVKVYALQEVKNNGDYALNKIEKMIRNDAVAVVSDLPSISDPVPVEDCGFTSQSALFLKMRDGTYSKIYSYTDTSVTPNIKRIAYVNSTDVNAVSYLTNNKVTTTTLAFTCDAATIAVTPTILVQITLTKTNFENAKENENVSLKYRNQIRLHY